MRTLEEIHTLGHFLAGYEKGPAKRKMSKRLPTTLMEAHSPEEAVMNLIDVEFGVTMARSGDFTKALNEHKYNSLVAKWILGWSGGRGAAYLYAFTPFTPSQYDDITED